MSTKHVCGPRMRFSEKWDKLDDEHFVVGALFSTWRPDNPRTVAHHRINIGRVHVVEVPGGHRRTLKGRAMLLGVGEAAKNVLDFTPKEIAADTYAGWGVREWHAWLERKYGPSYARLMLRELRFAVEEVGE